MTPLKNTPIKATLPSIGLSLKMLRDIPILAIPQQATELPEPGTTAVEKTIEEAPELPQADTPAVEKTAEEATDALNKN